MIPVWRQNSVKSSLEVVCPAALIDPVLMVSCLIRV